jgi:ATP/maltotriose-dependent transcriptional regulator MalT
MRLDYPLNLVCAPAGFGKTKLVCTWFNSAASGQGEKESSLPSAGLSLDENDSDLILLADIKPDT